MSYIANVTREGNDWLAEVRDLPGAHALARTLAALRRELADAIILSADLPDGSPVEIDLVLDDPQLAGLQAALTSVSSGTGPPRSPRALLRALRKPPASLSAPDGLSEMSPEHLMSQPVGCRN